MSQKANLVVCFPNHSGHIGLAKA